MVIYIYMYKWVLTVQIRESGVRHDRWEKRKPDRKETDKVCMLGEEGYEFHSLQSSAGDVRGGPASTAKPKQC